MSRAKYSLAGRFIFDVCPIKRINHQGMVSSKLRAPELTKALYDLGDWRQPLLVFALRQRFRDTHVATHYPIVAPSTLELAGQVLLSI
jgi:hypothetical protein